MTALRVLVVEDDLDTAGGVAQALAADGIECERASTGSEARKALEDPRLACAVLGVRVRDPSALELLDAMRRRTPPLQVIALAGAGDQDRVLEALRRGACDYLAKPVHAEELRLAVRRALEGHALATRVGELEAELEQARRTPPPAPPLDSEDARHAEMLREICDGMTREIEPERLLAASLRPLARALSARVASVLLIENETGTLVCEAQVSGRDVERSPLPRDAGLTGASLQAGAIVAAERPEDDARFDPEIDTPESGATGPLLVVPLKVRERVLGVARIFPAAETGAPVRVAELIAAPLSAATRNVLLYRSLIESVEDVARARRDAEDRR